MSNNVDWDYPAPYVIKKTVTADVIDGLQHVNNAAYVGWCQDAGWSHSIDLGLGLDEYHALDRAMAIRHSEFDYRLASYLADELLVATWLTHSDRKLTMERRFQVVRPSDGQVILRARWQLVCIQITTGKPKRMPKEFIDIYGAALIPVV